MMDNCFWTLQFDGHYAISCPSGKRANGNFKAHPEATYATRPKWEFEFCPYCGRKIELHKLKARERGEDDE